jgi:molecular chaperone DnaK
MVYDLGGGTFDVSILEVYEGVREVRATTGNTRLGGDDFDEVLVRLFLDKLKSTGVDPRQDVRAMARLGRLAEDTKIRLSSATEVTVREEFLTSDERGKPVHFELGVTRRRFEELIEPLLQSTIALSRQVVEEARLSGQQLGKICLVGGSTRIPRCRALLAEAFDVEIHEEIDPDLAVALGSSIQSGLLAGEELGRILVDVAAHSLGIRAIGHDDSPLEMPDTFAPVLHKNTVLPAQRTKEFYTSVDDQEKLEVEVFQGEAARVSQNTPVGSFEFKLLPVPFQSPVQVEFAYDLNGVVRVSVSQPGTDNAKTVALSLADAGRAAQAQRGTSAIERKAEALLGGMEPTERAALTRLLEAFRRASGPDKEAAEEALLDFFIDHEAEGDDDGWAEKAGP